MRSAPAAFIVLIVGVLAQGASEFYEPPLVKNSLFTTVKCPDGEDGILEVTSCSRSDWSREKIELYYLDGKPEKIVFYEYLKGQSRPDIRREINIGTDVDEKQISFYHRILDIVRPLEQAACSGSADQRRHLAKRLNENLSQTYCDRSPLALPPP